MEVTFGSAKMRRAFASPGTLAQKFGPQLGKVLERRINELIALPDLLAGFAIPHLHLHQLSNNRDEEFAVTLVGPKRLILRVAHDPVPRVDDGGIGVAAVTKVEITEVVDYH